MRISRKVLAVAGIFSVALIGGTFAYFNQTLSAVNPLDTGNYNTQLVEKFTPNDDESELKPGTHWSKIVGAKNTGDYPVLVRIKMDEEWTRTKDDGSVERLISISSIDGVKKNDGFNDARRGEGEPAYYMAKQSKHESDDESDRDGYVEDDHSVVYKNILTRRTVEGEWVDGGDGYWYWDGVLEKAGSGKDATTPVMDELVLASNVDLGKYEDHEWYAIEEEKPDINDLDAWTPVEPDWGDILDWSNDETKAKKENMSLNEYLKAHPDEKLWRKSESKVDPERLGYSDALYTLTITSEFVQANKAAVKSIWGDKAWGIVEGLDLITTDAEDENVLINAKTANMPLNPEDVPVGTVPSGEGETEPSQPAESSPSEGETQQGAEPAPFPTEPLGPTIPMPSEG